MILLDILDVLNDLCDDQRELVLCGLLEQLTQYSHYAILESQLAWNGDQPYKDFVEYQNDVIKECVKVEMSLFGIVLRREASLAPLTLRTEIHL